MRFDKKKFVQVIQFVSLISIVAFFGFMLCIYTSHLSYWKQVEPEEFLNWFSTYSRGISVGTGPLGVMSLAFPLITLIMIRGHASSRTWWIMSIFLILGIFTITILFFVNTNNSFMNRTISMDAIPQTLVIWGELHLARMVMALGAAFSAVIGIIKYQN